MTREEFEKLWEENKEHIRLNSEEYQAVKKSYYSWGLIDYALLIGGFVICETLFHKIIKSIILQYLLAIIGMIIIWVLWRFLKSRFTNSKTLEDIDAELKERYKKTLHYSD